MLRQPVKQGLPKHPVSPKGVLQILLRLVQIEQNDYFNYDLFKFSKMTIFIYNLFQVSKMPIFIYNLFQVSKMTVFYYELFKVSNSSVKQSSPGNFLKARFRCQKYVKKGT